MTRAATKEHDVTAEHEVSEEEQAKLAAEAAEAQARRDADSARFNVMFEGADKQARRAARTLSEQSLFDANDLFRRQGFNAMNADERKTYLDAQEALTPEQRYAPEQLHETEVAQEVLMVYLEKRPIPDKLAMTLLGIVKAHNAPPPPAP